MLEIWNCFEKTIATEKVSIKFSSVHLVCGFDKPDKLSSQSKKNTQSPKQATKCKVYFHHLFLKVLHCTLEMRLWQPWGIIFAGNPMLPFNDRKLSYKSFCFREEICKLSSAQIGYCFENHALLFCWKSKFFCLNFQKWLEKQFFQIKFPNFFSLRTLIGGLTHLTKQLCKKT